MKAVYGPKFYISSSLIGTPLWGIYVCPSGMRIISRKVGKIPPGKKRYFRVKIVPKKDAQFVAIRSVSANCGRIFQSVTVSTIRGTSTQRGLGQIFEGIPFKAGLIYFRLVNVRQR